MMTMEKRDKIELQVLLAKTWTDKIDPTGMFMSDKLDGVRGYWDHRQQKLYSRNGNEFMCPEWFKESFPLDNDLDGELWGGEGSFQDIVGIVKRLEEDEGWKKVKYVCFDVPTIQAKFSERYKFMEKWGLEVSPPSIKILEHVECAGLEHMNDILDKVCARGGEGIMLRNPSSMYERKRSSSLLKVKRVLDSDAVVTGYTGGTGKYTNMLGALKMKLPNGVEFEIGTGLTDKQRASPPAIGSVITFGYQELTKDGVPRFPRFIRERSALK